MRAQRSDAQARNRRLHQRQASSIQHSDRGMSHSIKFAETFAHSLVSVTLRIKNVSQIPIEAFVTQCSTSHRDACGLAAWAGNADAALYFLQAIDPGHCLSLVVARQQCAGRPFFLTVQMRVLEQSEAHEHQDEQQQ
jgi:hypothetical protein